MVKLKGRVNVQFCLTKEKFLKHTGSPLFANQINIISEDGLCLVKTSKRTVVLNKPIYIGATVLDLSKLLMFKFHYDTMKVKYPDALMMKTDTDSLLYRIETDDMYEDFKDPIIQKHVEFSNYPKNHMSGLFQDECVSDVKNPITKQYASKMLIISEYVGLRAKSYANKLWSPEDNDYEDKKKSKGVKTVHIKKRVDFKDYYDCQMQDKIISIGKNAEKEEHKEKIYSFVSHNLKMYSVEQSKIALSSKDDKRIPMKHNKLLTYAIGHYQSK